jgi:TrwC relaxase
VAARWLDDGITPNGVTGRAFTHGSVHGFDLTFAAPKSMSLLRALTDDIVEKATLAAHQKGIDAAMAYLHEHAGYTRVHNRVTGRMDLQRLPGLVGIAYQHEVTNAVAASTGKVTDSNCEAPSNVTGLRWTTLSSPRHQGRAS